MADYLGVTSCGLSYRTGDTMSAELPPIVRSVVMEATRDVDNLQAIIDGLRAENAALQEARDIAQADADRLAARLEGFMSEVMHGTRFTIHRECGCGAHKALAAHAVAVAGRGETP